MSSQPPSEKASELINKLPSQPGLVSKTGTAILGSGLIAAAISQELYVFNEETVILAGYAILFAYIGKVNYHILFIACAVSGRLEMVGVRSLECWKHKLHECRTGKRC